MQFFTFSFLLRFIFTWIGIGFVCAFVFEDMQASLFRRFVSFRGIVSIFVALSIILFLLLVLGINTTIPALLGFGAGILLQLTFLTIVPPEESHRQPMGL